MWTTCPGSLTVNATVRIESQVQRPNTTKPLGPSTCPHLFALWLTTLLFVRRSFGDGSHVDRIGGGEQTSLSQRNIDKTLLAASLDVAAAADIMIGRSAPRLHAITCACHRSNLRIVKQKAHEGKFQVWVEAYPNAFFPRKYFALWTVQNGQLVLCAFRIVNR